VFRRTLSRVLIGLPALFWLHWAFCLGAWPYGLASLGMLALGGLSIVSKGSALRNIFIGLNAAAALPILYTILFPWFSPVVLIQHKYIKAKYSALESRIEKPDPDQKAVKELAQLFGPCLCSDPQQAAYAVAALNNRATKYPKIRPLLDQYVLDRLRRLMRTGKVWDKVAASQAFRNYGPTASSAVPELIEGLKEGNGTIGWNCAEALGNMGSDARPADAALVEALDTYSPPTYGSEGPQLAYMACLALAKIGFQSSATTAALEKRLSHPSIAFRAHAALALLSLDLQNAAAQATLREIFRSGPPVVQGEILWGSEEYFANHKLPLEILRLAQNSTNEHVQTTARRLLNEK
jgi:hypothetical protein